MKRFKYLLIFCLTLVWLPLVANGQPVAGLPPFASFSGGPADTIDNGNVNVHLEAPVFSRTGRGITFSYSLGYDSSVWSPISSGGTSAWTPVPNWGWTGITQVQTGYISYQAATMNSCMGNPFVVYNNFVYHDSFGTTHVFGTIANPVVLTNYQSSWGCGNIPNDPSGTTADGSGFQITLSLTGGSPPVPTLVSLVTPAGVIINAPFNNSGVASGSLTDPNGNVLSVTSSGGTTSFYDTLSSSAVLTLTGSGTSSSPYHYAYPNPAGGTSIVVVNFQTYSVKTNFGCSGITEYSSSQPLISSIVYPDGTKYSFTYEATPSNSGYVTGRVASISLPAGGTISYAYSGGNNGINCEDGTPATLTRTTPDGGWTYVHAFFAPPSTVHSATDITDPQGNVTLISFQGIYEVQRQTFEGSNTGGTMLSQTDTCYNSTATAWPCPTTAVSTPISEIGVRTGLPPTPFQLINQSAVVSFYNSYGLPTETDEYNYGNLTTPLRKKLVSYASLGNGIVNRPSVMSTQSGTGTYGSFTAWNYDAGPPIATSGTPNHVAVSGSRGNLTSLQTNSSSSTAIIKSFSYYDTGNVYQMTDTNSAVTTYNYSSSGSCGNSFVTSVNQPLSLTTSQTWDCGGAVVASTTDANGKVTSTAYSDPNFWRPTSVTDPTSATTNVSYLTGPIRRESSLIFNSNNSTSDQRTLLDGLGRQKLSQTRQAPGGTTYNIVETDYDSVGRPNRTTMPYSASADTTNSSAPATVTTYDTFSRPLTVVDGGGGTTTYTYNQNDVLVVVTPAPSGENAKQRQLEYDALGRLTSVCEITSAAGSGTCGQKNAKTGYWTTYTYDLNDNLIGVTQNAQAASGSQQTRTYSFDWLSRLTSETNPESATTAYTYDTDSTCGTSQGDKVKRVDAVGNVTCFAYDALHRNTAITYPSGSYASVTPAKTFVYDSATVNSVAMVNTKGRLAEAYTGSSSSKITDLGFSYSVRGETSDVYQSSPHSGGYYHVSAAYWANGLTNTLTTNLSGMPNWTYAPDSEGRVTSITASSGQSPVTGVTYNSFSEPTQVTYGAGYESFQYDSNTGRMLTYMAGMGGTSYLQLGTLTWNANGTLGQLAINDRANGSHTCTYAHDDLSRIASANCGSPWSQTFSFDAFGNLTKSGTLSWMPTYSSATNRYASLPSGSPSYDANGNDLADGFHTYMWDADGNMASIDGNALMYDAFDRRVEQTVSGTTTEFLQGLDGAKFASMSAQTVGKLFLALPGGGGAVYFSGGLTYYRRADWQGSSRFASTPSLGVYYDKEFAPFGEVFSETGTSERSFTGQNNDLSTGLYDFLFREYDPTQGRWIVPDPAGAKAVDPTNPQSWNRYAYVAGNPLARIDRKGLCTVMFTSTATGPAANCNSLASVVWYASGLLPSTISGGASATVNPFQAIDSYSSPGNGLSQASTINTFDQGAVDQASSECGAPNGTSTCGGAPKPVDPYFASLAFSPAPAAITGTLTLPFAPDPGKQAPPKCPKGTHPNINAGAGLDLAPFAQYACVPNRP